MKPNQEAKVSVCIIVSKSLSFPSSTLTHNTYILLQSLQSKTGPAVFPKLPVLGRQKLQTTVKVAKEMCFKTIMYSVDIALDGVVCFVSDVINKM